MGAMADSEPASDLFTEASLALARSANATSPMRCCCGSVECLYLKHNYTVLDSVEKDVHTAARMGQALLARHEAYMADVERDRTELTARIAQLEMDNKELQERNTTVVEENRSLLDQLESLNTSVSDSESRIKSLEAGLLSSQQMIRRLESETERARLLERQIAFLEQEQEELQSTLTLSREEARSAASRWKQAERGILDLQEQLERMEREMREERKHHVEMMGRIEKQREMEKELNTAAGRLKGAAAFNSLNQNSTGSAVVSNFVRDLLQDNAHLQQGMAQLREMLINSNDEIQALREQLMYHQPAVESQDGDAPPSTLRAELGGTELSPTSEQPPRLSQEFHIHHHYHVAAKQDSRKAKKKRPGLSAGVFIPPALHHAATQSMYQSRNNSSDHGDNHRMSRWSILSDQPSEFAPSSAPSSPNSNRNSVFDPRMDTPSVGSPTTSIDPMSPSWRSMHRKQPSNLSARSFQLATPFSPTLPPPGSTHTIVEECDDGDTVPELLNNTDESAPDDETSSSRDHEGNREDVSIVLTDTDDEYMPGRGLHRTISHESIISLSGGLDIHTLKARPSQLTLRHLGSAATLTTSSTVTARPILSRDSAKRSSTMLRDTYRMTPMGSLRSVSSSSTINGSSMLGSWAGWRPWASTGSGTSAAAHSSRNTDNASTTTSTASAFPIGSASKPSSSLDTTTGTTPKPINFTSKKTVVDKSSAGGSMRYYGRSPGINQPGAIPGFNEFLAAAQKRVPPSRVEPVSVDHNALREVLDE